MAAATTFEFRAMDLAGTTSSGELEADSKAAVGEQLRQRGLIVLDVSEKKSPVNVEDFFKKWKGPDMRELAVFSRQFATLVASGMPMLRTLETLEQQTKDEQIQAATASLRADVEAGSTLEQGMDTIRELDVVVANALRLDPIRLGAWRAARRIDALNPPVTEEPSDPDESTPDTTRPAAAPNAAPEADATLKAL